MFNVIELKVSLGATNQVVTLHSAQISNLWNKIRDDEVTDFLSYLLDNMYTIIDKKIAKQLEDDEEEALNREIAAVMVDPDDEGNAGNYIYTPIPLSKI